MQEDETTTSEEDCRARGGYTFRIDGRERERAPRIPLPPPAQRCHRIGDGSGSREGHPRHVALTRQSLSRMYPSLEPMETHILETVARDPLVQALSPVWAAPDVKGDGCTSEHIWTTRSYAVTGNQKARMRSQHDEWSRFYASTAEHPASYLEVGIDVDPLRIGGPMTLYMKSTPVATRRGTDTPPLPPPSLAFGGETSYELLCTMYPELGYDQAMAVLSIFYSRHFFDVPICWTQLGGREMEDHTAMLTVHHKDCSTVGPIVYRIASEYRTGCARLVGREPRLVVGVRKEGCGPKTASLWFVVVPEADLPRSAGV